jgi:hypothetical protein
MDAKARLKKRPNNKNLTPRKLSKLRRKMQQQVEKKDGSRGVFSGLLLSKMLQRRRAVNDSPQSQAPSEVDWS